MEMFAPMAVEQQAVRQLLMDVLQFRSPELSYCLIKAKY
jgi:hypothetical protein